MRISEEYETSIYKMSSGYGIAAISSFGATTFFLSCTTD